MTSLIYTMAEVQVILDCEDDTVRTLIQDGKIAAVKAGRSWIFPRAAFDDRLNEWATDEAAAKRVTAAPNPSTKPLVNQPLPGAGRRRIPPTLQAATP